VGALAQYLHPALWHDWFAASAAQLNATGFWLAVLQIIVINVLLSGDNAVVIAMACRSLPPEQRRWGIVIGAGAAVILRILFVGIVARLILLPYLKLIGGLALLVIAAKLIVPDAPERDAVRAAAQLWRAVMIIVVADIVMSLDNIIAIAAVAQGNLLLLVFGLAVSIPLIMAGAALITALLDRFPILIWAGAGLLGWVAGGVIATDPAVVRHLSAAFGPGFAQEAELAAASAATLLAVAAGGLWWRWQEAARIHAATKPAQARNEASSEASAT
jgi:YjbE family integral membrane protein